MKVRFAHIADAHIGGWRDPKMSELSVVAFERAIDICLDKKVDFVIIAGDLFNTALPGIEFMNAVVKKLLELKTAGIRVYAIQGSHDFSPSGKTFLSTLEKACLLKLLTRGSLVDDKLVLEPTVDDKTNIVLFGMLGLRSSLERNYYEILDASPFKSYLDKFKIFVFHSAVVELTQDANYLSSAIPLSNLPEGFDYYAAGHVHSVIEKNVAGKYVVYPGPVFPNNFSELEKLKHGGFYLVEVDTATRNFKTEYVPIIVKNVYTITIDADGKSPSEITSDLVSAIDGREFYDTIVLFRVSGTLKNGKVSDINFNDIIKKVYEKGAYFVMKNTYSLETEETEGIKVNSLSTEDIENKTISENLKSLNGVSNTEEFFKELMTILSSEPADGETKSKFELRLDSELAVVLKKLVE